MKIRSVRAAVVFLASASLLFSACRKDEPAAAAPASLTIRIHHRVDQQELFFDSMMYVNDAGNPYLVDQLLYYVSAITFYKANGMSWTDPSVHYIDARDPSTLSFELAGVPAGQYSSCTLLLGVPVSKNVAGGLPPTMENNYMVWPEIMGGGYHFMKFEGYFHADTVNYGFAVHLGKNGFQSQAGCPVSLQLTGAHHEAKLDLNLNEFFRTPYTYNLDTDGNYTMGDSLLMKRISDNAEDAFSMEQTQ